MILDRYRLGQLRKGWRFRTSSLLLPSVVAIDHPLIAFTDTLLTRISQSEWNENGTKTEWKKDGYCTCTCTNVCFMCTPPIILYGKMKENKQLINYARTRQHSRPRERQEDKAGCKCCSQNDSAHTIKHKEH